jgi:MarR-like DNA-binding transcriptional regulator SgrR of sgrS sRNA
MKSIAIIILTLLAFTANSQSLKEALYGGKLKADTGAVLRKGDNQKIQENMAQKVVADSINKITEDSIKLVVETEKKDSIETVKKEAVEVAKGKAVAEGRDTTNFDTTAVFNAMNEDAKKAESKAVSKDNTVVWKTYVDEMAASIKAEALQSNKVKKGNYFVLIDYRVNPDGQVSITNVTVDPENSFLAQNIKDRFTLNPAKLAPIVDANGRARTVNRKQTMNLSK